MYSTSGTCAGLESVIFEVRVFRKETNLYIGSPYGSLVYITALGKAPGKPNHRQEQLRKNRIFHVVGTDPLRAPQQKKQCGEANKNKVARILVCPAFFDMHWDLLKLKCAQNLGLRLIPVLGARLNPQWPRRGWSSSGGGVRQARAGHAPLDPNP